MHEDHEKADIASLLLQGLVVALPDVFSDGFVKKLLTPMPFFPCDRGKLRAPGFEERLAIGIDGLAFLGADNVGPAAVQPNPDTEYLKLRRSFVALACQRGVCYECKRKPESGIGGQGDSPEYAAEVHV